MEIDLVNEGLKFMILGMVTVFLFLILMVTTLKIQSFILGIIFPNPQTDKTNLQTRTANDTQLIAVITAAITKFRNENKG